MKQTSAGAFGPRQDYKVRATKLQVTYGTNAGWSQILYIIESGGARTKMSLNKGIGTPMAGCREWPRRLARKIYGTIMGIWNTSKRSSEEC